MSADKPGKANKPNKPFLGEDELSSELDAWDEMFDNLHDAGPSDAGQAAPMDWPEPAAAIESPPPSTFEPSPSSPVPQAAHGVEDAGRTIDDLMPPGPDEADFSDVGGSELPAFADMDAGGATRLVSQASLSQALGAASDDDDEVYTSASRPNVKSPPSRPALPEDSLAAPPKAAPARRTGPAIIRRVTPTAVPTIAEPRVTPGRGYPAQDSDAGPFSDDLGDSTRIGDFAEIQAKAEESRGGDRSRAPTSPPPSAFAASGYDAQPSYDDDDDEYEIEIGSSDDAEGTPAPAPELPAQPRRTAANVIRRDPTKMTIPPVQRGSEPVIEVSREPTPVPGGEDDFSDVAAAVQEEEAAASGSRPAEPLAEDSFSDVAAALGADPLMDELPSPRPTLPGMAPPKPPPSALHAVDDDDVEGIIDGSPPARMQDELELGASADPYVAMTTASAEPRGAGPAGTLEEVPVPQVVDSFDVEQPATPLEGQGADRPPALLDLYPRVKRPTSVPAMAGRAMEPAALSDRQPPSTQPRVRTSVAAPFGDTPEVEPALDLEAIGVDSQWPEQLPPIASSSLDEEAARLLLVYERELPTVDEPAASAALRIEAGRLCERIGDIDRARAHYDAALLVDPRATAALRGLRRVARTHGDLAEITRLLDAEIAVAGALERRPLGHYRVDLLMASGDHDLARVAVGDILDSAPSDVRALLAQLELAFVDGRADEFGRALERLAHAVTDPHLRAAVQQARGMLAAHHSDAQGAATWFAQATESEPGSLVTRLAAIREAAAHSQPRETAQAMIDLANIVQDADPLTAAALAVRSLFWTDLGGVAVGVATKAMPADPLVARVVAETALAGKDPIAATSALTTWASSAASPVERAYAAARAAELDASRGVELWGQALQLDPGDDYAAAQLRTAHVAVEQTAASIAIDRQVASDPTRERARLRAAFGMIAQGQLDEAIGVLEEGRAARPTAIALAEALAEALAAAGRWADRAKLLAELADHPGDQLDPDVAQLRSALAWEEAVGAALSAPAPDAGEIQRATVAALGAWEKVGEQAQGSAPEAHAAAIVLAARLGDKDVIAEVLARAQAAERSAWGQVSIALRRARLFYGDDPDRAEALLEEVAPQLDDPRRVVTHLLAAARRGDVAAVASTLEERATLLGDTTEASGLRLRAAQLALDAGDAMLATTLLRAVEIALPGVSAVSDLLAVARRRAGDSSGPIRVPKEGSGAASPDEFARIVRDADDAAERGDGVAALTLYQSALDMRPSDPLAAVPMVRVATTLREPAPIAAFALAQLRAAEAAGDGRSKADAYELLSHIDRELRSDAGSAQVALESASQADPTRVDLMHRLEREYTVNDQVGELLRLRRAELDQIPAELARDRAAMVMDTAALAERDARPDAELAELYRAAVAADPKYRLALLYLESIVRRAGASEELARLEEQIAAYFDGDERAQAAFLTRAGHTLVELGRIDMAVAAFRKASQVSPAYAPALEGWRSAALRGELWVDAAEAATRQASIGAEPEVRARLHHFAGVALMDKALMGEEAAVALRHALEAEPGHRDAFVRLRILLEEHGEHDGLAILLANRLEHEPEGPRKLELHRALAELSRNFLTDRETAKKHYRAILEVEPNDLRAHAAIADIAWEEGEWQEAADALVSRARLEHDPSVLRTLCFRLGLIYADRLVDVPMALKAFQRALTYNPDDTQTLERLADLATQAGEWRLALGACERLVKNEDDGDKRAVHLHRVARIFRQGFGDMKRAERALNLALDNAPTSDDALSELVMFYREAGDMTSVRVHLNRVAGTMRTRLQTSPQDGVAYRVISRAMSARAAVGVDGSTAVARAAAELAQLCGEAGEPERLLLAEPARTVLAPLLRGEADDVLFPRSVQVELRQIFTLLGDRVAKHVGVDLRALYGVARGDRLKARESAIATHAQDVATALGFGEIDVYVSARSPFAMVAEPTSPVSLVLGQSIAQMDARAVRFAAGSALKLAQSHLAIAARLSPDELGVLVVALLRQFQDRFPGHGLDENAIASQLHKLKRLIPTGLAHELRPFAAAIDAQGFSPTVLSRDLRVAGYRAGLIAGGSIVAGLSVLAAAAGTDARSFLADPVAQGILQFAVGEDHATLSR